MGQRVILPFAGQRFAGLVYILAPASDDSVVRVSVQKCELPREAVGARDVVGIHARDDRRTSVVQQFVQARDEPAVFANDWPDARIPCGIFAQDLRACVVGTIVENEKLEIAEGLVEDALDGGHEKALAIIDAHCDADCRGGHLGVFPAFMSCRAMPAALQAGLGYPCMVNKPFGVAPDGPLARLEPAHFHCILPFGD